MPPKIVSNFWGAVHITVSLSLVVSSKETDHNKIAIIKPYLQGYEGISLYPPSLVVIFLNIVYA